LWPDGTGAFGILLQFNRPLRGVHKLDNPLFAKKASPLTTKLKCDPRILERAEVGWRGRSFNDTLAHFFTQIRVEGKSHGTFGDQSCSFVTLFLCRRGREAPSPTPRKFCAAPSAPQTPPRLVIWQALRPSPVPGSLSITLAGSPGPSPAPRSTGVQGDGSTVFDRSPP